ncbi:hypothetical protein K435DRAFT_240987 [Dendrothele bispora CBS 962.96]|uniref:Zn(2)-C6 fungal-type domain-containing protein n=1 Tax=Dendrothele bispora (strain CBS 962.96) TaxID=1314807 RepID=A0A4V4HHS7_DENBC|nr:hypothetical protein K435DRAFT_240987 [Dendrothele bispora CBS 962.96]
MSPSASDRVVDERPSKRARKGSTVSELAQSPQIPYASSQVDHIFISEENLASKKPGKKNPLSCCECRRLKLKCDRTFPCGSCKKRGVSDICPDGVLVSGKGTRFILANTEQLHEKINDMSGHIRKLEEALEQATAGSHPLLQPDMLNMKSTMELYKMTQPGKSEGPSNLPHPSGSHDRTPPSDIYHEHATPSHVSDKAVTVSHCVRF